MPRSMASTLNAICILLVILVTDVKDDARRTNRAYKIFTLEEAIEEASKFLVYDHQHHII